MKKWQWLLRQLTRRLWVRAALLSLSLIGIIALSATNAAYSQLPNASPEPPANTGLATPPTVEVTPTAQDAEIGGRLADILTATGWFDRPSVRVDQGVVFLGGDTSSEEHKQWAGTLARSTRDVVATVNEIRVRDKAIWDLSAPLNELSRMSSSVVRRVPTLLVAGLLLIATWFATKWSMRGAASIFSRRLKNRLLRDVASRMVAVPVFLIGLYIVLSVSGLTGLAVTVIGGTGLMGLIIGFAFRDIAENFLASVLISIQRPFATNDLIEVAGYKGFIQSVNPRSTLLMTLDGNHVQIPNATIYKETIVNFTANPIARFDFAIGIGYDDSIAKAQSVALHVLAAHPAVIDDPEPLALVDALGAATINLRIYYWIDATKYSQLKVRSAVIRLTKRAFAQAGISMPDEAREVVFPRAVPIQILSEQQVEPSARAPPQRSEAAAAAEEAVNPAEHDLTSEAREIERQAKETTPPEGGPNLLESS